MKRNPFGIETKTAASTAIGGLVTLVLLLNTWQHWFTPPPAGTVAAIEATMVGLVGYFAKHTPRPELKVTTVTGSTQADFTQQIADEVYRLLKPSIPVWSYSTSPVPPGHGQGYAPAARPAEPAAPAAPPAGPGTPPAAPPAATEPAP